ncbi:MAG: uncharacterized protein JWL83_3710 [Actinomycetia bacterium]|nr:uncharacterized protein [Actinomycetes bacterium]
MPGTDYRVALRKLEARGVSGWDTYLRHNSRLPGPRANLELLEAAVEEGDQGRFRHWCDLDRGGEDVPDEFVLMCGVVGIGRQLAEAFDTTRRAPAGLVRELRRYANDERWRVRDAVTMALHRVGDVHVRPMFDIADAWGAGTPLERRAAVAAVCEPRFVLAGDAAGRRILDLLDVVTGAYAAEPDRRADPVIALRKTLEYGWAVAVADNPERGGARFEAWVASNDDGIRRIVRKNLDEPRLQRALPADVERWIHLVEN